VDGQFENYTVQANDLPLFEVKECNLSGAQLCIRQLTAGDRAAIAFRLDRSWLEGFNRMALLFDLLLASILATAIFVGRTIVGGRRQSTA
jgi:hypothetical protein